MWIIQDWAGNRLTNSKGQSVEFATFGEGWDYIHEHYDEEDYQELSVEPNPNAKPKA